MSKINKYVLVLWAGGFEEAIAAILVTELRHAGLLVKVVSLTRHPTRGAHGLALGSDLTLAQASSLLPETTHLIIPATCPALYPLKNDPFLAEFLAEVNRHRIPILLPCGGNSGLEIGLEGLEHISYFPADNALLLEFLPEFVQGVEMEGENV